jgi:sugar phosphate isomerase/epimerase
MLSVMSIKQSVAYWCLADSDWQWSAEQICRAACDLGLSGLDLCPPDSYPMLRKYKLQDALCWNGMPGAPFVKGLNNLEYHEQVISSTKQSIDRAAQNGFPNVIAFTGYKWRNAEDPASGEISREECLTNCVKGLSDLAAHAEAKGVTLCLEHLNSRVSSHPMKGHPGYQGDNVEFCAEIVRKVHSSNVKLLFDFYHVQVMHGDLIERLGAHHDVIGHLHTAGCPGRNEFDDNQEINYAGVVNAIREIGYSGYIGHEFIPTRDPMDGLTAAVKLFKS